MKTYLAIFTGTAAAMDAFRKLPPAEMARQQAEGSQAWHAWAAKHQASIVAMGGSGIVSETTRATEAAVRGFWTFWRRLA